MLDPNLPDFYGMIYGRPGKQRTLNHTESEPNMDHPQDAAYFGFLNPKPAFTIRTVATSEEEAGEPTEEDITTQTEKPEHRDRAATV